MDSVVYAMVRQVAAMWSTLMYAQGHSADQATEVGMMQAALFLSDLGIVQDAQPYLDGARDAMNTARHLRTGQSN
ncbi:hypothetical protein [Deinococcus sedimenti]|uniref:Uncharacterized protein n=1 Tax=Deinococcus sedimenti TaxID=1867090 RepID=A0ABQ2S641_9DEIO|nr:hypothetical protein [Deinococcus sedimenti]GGR92707.1 hypothetical protein GCM10008960_19600 [Deinococcus sedimenti]